MAGISTGHVESAAPAQPRVDDLPEQLARHIEVDETTGCWLWVTLSGDPPAADRYGQATWNGVKMSAHRAVWLALVGEIPPDRPQLDHLCEVHRCVRPILCLEPVTHRENCRRAGRSRARRARERRAA